MRIKRLRRHLWSQLLVLFYLFIYLFKLVLISLQIKTVLGLFFWLRNGGEIVLPPVKFTYAFSFVWFPPAPCWNAAFWYLLKCHSQRYCAAIKFCQIILCAREDVDRAAAPSFSYYLVFNVLQLVCTINLVQGPPLLYVISVLTSLLPNVFLLLSHLKAFLHSVTSTMSHFPPFIYLHTFPRVHLTWLQLLLFFLIKDYFQYTFFTPSVLRVLSSLSLWDYNDWVENRLIIASCVQKANLLRLPW